MTLNLPVYMCPKNNDARVFWRLNDIVKRSYSTNKMAIDVSSNNDHAPKDPCTNILLFITGVATILWWWF